MSERRRPKDEEREGSGPRAMQRVLGLFDVLADAPDGLSLADLSEALETPKSTLISTLKALLADDFLAADGALYRLGPRAFRLAARISSAWSLTPIVRGYMRELAKRTGESVGLAVLDREMRRFVYVEIIESAQPVRYAMRLGMSGPLHATAAGRVLLAHQPEAYREAFLESADLPALTAHTTTDAAALRAQLEEVRRAEVWTSIGESIADSAGMAAPIFGPDGEIAAALSLGAPVERLQARQTALEAEIAELARRASGRLAGG